MKKEVRNYLSIGFLVLAVLILAYLLNLGITGFAVFVEPTDFDNPNATYDKVYYNGTAIILNETEISGTYVSYTFNATKDVQWNNLTWSGKVFENTSLSFYVCGLSDCSAEDFTEANLSNLNLTGQYFQYKIVFERNNESDESPSLKSISVTFTELEEPEEAFLIIIYSPLDQTYDVNEIGLDVTSTFNESVWWYALNDGDNTLFTPNTTITAEEGTNTLIVYVNDTEGNVSSESVSFTVCIPEVISVTCGEWICGDRDNNCEETISCGTCEGDDVCEDGECVASGTIITPTEPVITPPEASLSASEISAFSLNPGSSQKANLVVTNTGTKHLISCAVRPMGEFDSWILVSEEATDINIGKQHEFSFDVTVPEETGEGPYSLKVSITCSEIFTARDFTVNVEKKKLEFNIISADRTRDDRVRIIYSLEELAGEDQDVVFAFSLVDANNIEVGRIEVNQSIDANSTDEFRTNININESLLPINETTNETLESELTLNVNFNSQIYSSSIQEKVLIGAPIGGFAIFEGVGAGEAIIFVVVLFVLVFIFVFARRMRRKGKALKDLFKGSGPEPTK